MTQNLLHKIKGRIHIWSAISISSFWLDNVECLFLHFIIDLKSSSLVHNLYKYEYNISMSTVRIYYVK